MKKKQKEIESKKEKVREKKDELKGELKEKTKGSERKDDKKEETGMVGHKVQEIAHTVNANLKQNVGIGLGNFSSEVDREKASEHQKKYDEKCEENKQKLEEKKEELKEKTEKSGETGIYGHKLQEVGHTINANLKETVGFGVGDYPSEVDREKVNEHQKEYEEKVKEQQKPEIEESSSLTHKIKEVAHNVNANIKEMIGIGVGNYSSEVDRELANLHKQKYEEKVHDPTSNLDDDLNKDDKEEQFGDKYKKRGTYQGRRESQKR